VPFVAVSPSTAAALAHIGVPRDQLRWAPLNAVDPPPVAVDKAPDPLFVVVGRLVPHKRVDLVLRIWDEVRRRTGGQLLVVGDGPERSRLESLAGPSVTFAGRVEEDEKWELMARAWLLVTAAHHEGWGVSIIEAGAVGTPALGFDVPGVRDAVVDGVSGLLATSPGEFAQRWVSFGLDGARSQSLGEGARQVAARFTWDSSVSQFEYLATAAATGRPLPGQPGSTPGVAESHGVDKGIENHAMGR
jgi:glycosyltransferase involved in cell wall biosynthesis